MCLLLCELGERRIGVRMDECEILVDHLRWKQGGIMG